MPPRPVRTNRVGSPYRSPTPNRPQNDPFATPTRPRNDPFNTPTRPQNDPFAVSPETRRQRTLQEMRLKNQQNAEERAKRYAEKFKNFINANVNHALVNSNNVNKIKNPVYLLSDVMHDKNGKVRHVYSREYLNKTFKNKSIFKSPMTGVPTHPDLVKRYTSNVKNVNVSKFQRERAKLINFFGKNVYEESLELDHMRLGFRTYHWKFLNTIMQHHNSFDDFPLTRIANSLMPTRKKLKSIATISYRDMRKINYIMNGLSRISRLDFITQNIQKFVIKHLYVYAYVLVMYDVPTEIRNIIRSQFSTLVSPVKLRNSISNYPNINHVINVIYGRR
jgi:hypothetical protein